MSDRGTVMRRAHRASCSIAVWATIAGCVLACFGAGTAADGRLLWEIGEADGKNADLALAPRGYAAFREDGLFVVGESDPARDWPYAQPGPVDGWAGGRPHAFAALFGLASAPADGECRLLLDLVDTHSTAPPRLAIRVNDFAAEIQLPAGGGDASIFGDPSKGRRHAAAVTFPAARLRKGDNEVRVETVAGSWLLWDRLGLETPPGAELGRVAARTLVEAVRPVRALKERGGALFQPVVVDLRRFGGGSTATVRVEGEPPLEATIGSGRRSLEVLVPAVAAETKRRVSVEVVGETLPSREVTLRPVRKLLVYLLPHSHTDIGYTEIQTAIEKRQVDNLVQGMAWAEKTSGYPAGSRFVWNVEVLWAADLYLRRLGKEGREAFLDAVKEGRVGLEGMYLNELTGLCRPEELIRLFRFGTKIRGLTGAPVTSAMISDVPGTTWGTVTAMAQAGIRYFSVAPNYFDRIGTILREWENKPFWWVGPDGASKVLVWIPLKGYALSHVIGKLSVPFVDEFCTTLERMGYPYDIAHLRWSGHGDNAVPDPAICEFVKSWSSEYAWPRFVISTTAEAFVAFEARHGSELPLVRGDWTPYWEDGAGSSALETSMNRWSSDRVAQAEALWAMLQPSAYPAAEFEDAWNSVLLYSEHTWGAWCSVGEPERKETIEQWEIKRGYALRADAESRGLLDRSVGPLLPAAATPGVLRVVNASAWPRTDLAVAPAGLSRAGDRVEDDRGRAVPSQRLASGELAFLAVDVPALGWRGYRVVSGSPASEGRATARENVLENGRVRVEVDATTGGIAALSAEGSSENLVDPRGGEGLNDYLYLIGDDLAGLRRNAPVSIRPGETGPLVASLVVESDAPGCHRLRREIRVVAGSAHVELVNTVDKERLAAASYHAKDGKESVNFAFPFAVPDGVLRLEVPFGVIRPDVDQIPSACKNWFTVGRWADVSGPKGGITWVTLDAPLVQVGGITATLLNSQSNPDVWRSRVEPTQRIYSWAMNNHWGTNYRAYQEGPVVFRFVLRPHSGYDPAEASRFAASRTQPLLVLPDSEVRPASPSLVRVEPADVIVAGIKPSDDGKALIVRLFGAGGKDAEARLAWAEPPRRTWRSDTSEQPIAPQDGPVRVPAFGVVTLRAER